MVIQPSQRPVERIQDAHAKAVEAQPATGNTGQLKALKDGPQEKVLKKARLQVLSGAFAGRELELSKALTTLGRPGVQVAAITRRSDGFYIVHVEADRADNYPLVNGTPIGAQARRLADNDVIQLAGVKMGFFES
jgi:hypothetical protein